MNNYEKLQAVLREIFEIDKADLDFGIYRIMNQKRDDVNKFIEKQLPKDIKKILSQTQSKDSVQLQQDLDKLGSDLDNAGVVRESSPKYLELKKMIEASVDLTAMEQEIFSHLTNFFKRYYNEGDFISQRRYKKDVYAIPYEGEEVKLHWANADQYYIKTSEYLKNYAFVLPNEKKVTFQLKEASTEQNNNKAQGDGERRFAIYEEEPLEVDGINLTINFTYELHKKSVKQDVLMKEAFETISSNLPVDFAEICASGSAPTEKNKNRTLLEKHLNDYVSRNTFDYFIHKDLGGFLRRELDFYIKNEILYIDDINTENPAFFTAQLSKIKAFKTVADKIITFLAQIEDFQKKLWLKKKFVIRTDYCITLDKIPAKYYEEIFSNAEQLKEWENLFSVKCELNNGKLTINDQTVVLNEINNSSFTIHNYLVLDTKFFSEEFKDKLIAEFYNLDEETNGLLINSENFQALNLMQEKYQEKIQTIYIDPPYNTGSDGFAYKDNYEHSSWLSFMSSRIVLAHNLIKSNGTFWSQCDENENARLKIMLDNIFNGSFLNNIAVKMSEASGVKMNHAKSRFPKIKEYILLYSKNNFDGFKEIDKYKSEEWDSENNIFLENFTKDDRLVLSQIEFENRTSSSEVNKINQIFNKVNRISLSEKMASLNIEEPKEKEKWLFENSYRIIKTAGSSSLAKVVKSLKTIPNQDIAASLSSSGVLFYYITDFNRNTTQPRLQVIFADSNIYKNPCDFWQDIKTTGAIADEGGIKLSNGKKPEKLIQRIIKMSSEKSDVILDYFGGSGTTYATALKMGRRFIGIEMQEYFRTYTLKRIKNVLNGDGTGVSKENKWKGGGFVKYQVLESYEDTLNNLILAQKDLGELGFNEEAQEEYLLRYMLDVESRDHLFNVEIFKNPFDYKLKVTENNELIPTKVDLVETFNYLIGLYVEHIQRTKDIKFVEGTTREGVKTLVIWRNLETTSNKETKEVFRRLFESERTSEFHQIYINGDHNLTNFRTGEDQFKVKMIEETFFKKMFNVNEL